jgi:hypothetical protein
VKRVVGISIRLGKMNDGTLWRGRPPPKRKKTAHIVRGGDVGAPATLGSFAPTDRQKDYGSKYGPTGT